MPDLDPRIESNAEEIKKIKEAIMSLAAIVDGIAWRTSSEEERKGINVVAEIKEKLVKPIKIECDKCKAVITIKIKDNQTIDGKVLRCPSCGACKFTVLVGVEK